MIQIDMFTGERAGEYPIPLSLTTVDERGGVRYALTHFADCPHGREWRKSRS